MGELGWKRGGVRTSSAASADGAIAGVGSVATNVADARII